MVKNRQDKLVQKLLNNIKGRLRNRLLAGSIKDVLGNYDIYLST